VYQGESDAFLFSLKRKVDAPLPGYFQPVMWYPPSGRRPSFTSKQLPLMEHWPVMRDF
jgi:hypothetical protein